MTIRPTFDTAKYLGTLSDAGVPDAQARAQTKALSEALEEAAGDYVRQDGLERLEGQLARLETKLESRIEAIENRLGERLEGVRADLYDKLRVQGWALLGGVAALIAAATAIIKLTP